MPWLDPNALAQPEAYREGPLADDPPSHVDLDTDEAGIETAPATSSDAVMAADHLADRLHEHRP